MNASGKRLDWWLVLGALCAGAAVRAAYLNTWGPWFDEVYFSVFARPWQSGGVNGFFDLLGWIHGNDVHPPVYFALLLYWIKLFGQSAVALRLPSLLFGLATIPAAYALGRDALGRRVGLALAWLIALAPAHVWYSVEARPYALLTLLTTLSCWLCWRLLFGECKRGTLMAYAVVTVLLPGTHHLGWFVIAGQAALAALHWKQADKRAITSPFIAGLIALPWLTFAFAQGGTRFRHLSTFSPTAINELLRFITPAALIDPAWLRLVFDLAMAALLIGAIIVAVRDHRKSETAKYNVALFFFGFLLVPLAALIAASLLRPLLHEKLGVMLLAPALAAPAWAAMRLPKRWVQFAAMALLLVAGALSSLQVGAAIRKTPDYRAAHAYLASPEVRELPVVLSATWWNATYLYYEPGERALFANDRPRLVDLLKQQRPFFLLVETATSTADSIIDSLNAQFDVERVRVFHRLWLYRLTPKPAP